jgi:peptidyl-Asp metalloendopeptidase
VRYGLIPAAHGRKPAFTPLQYVLGYPNASLQRWGGNVMRAILAIGLLSGLLAGYSTDRAQTLSHHHYDAASTLPGDTSSEFESRRPSSIAGLGDRGSLIEYGTQPPVRKGGHTWHAVQLSEDHALRAIVAGSMVVVAPNGQPIRLQYERHIEHPDGNWTWVGRPAGTRPGVEAIVTFGEKAVFGTIPYGDRAPLQLTMAGGRTWLVETDKTLLSDQRVQGQLHEEDFLVPLASAGKSNRNETGPTSSAAPVSAAMPSAKMPSAQGVTAEAASASTTVDVVIGYTTGFATRLGGQSQAVTRLNFMIDVANQAYVNSQVTGQVRMVNSLMVNYPDATTNRAALFELTGVNCVTAPGGQLPDGGVSCTNVAQPAALQPLIAARERYGADLVSLVRKLEDPEQQSCGLGWMLGNGQTAIGASSAAFGMSVVSDSSGLQFPDNGNTCRDETLAHELGHNMGLQHDRARAQGADDTNGDGNLLDPEEYGRFAYSFGYNAPLDAGNFYTVMAIPGAGQTGYRVFSNPRLTTCNDFPCGVTNQSDNARALTQTLPIIAAFRAAVAPIDGTWFRGDFNGDGKSDILWRNRSTGANGIWRSAMSTTPQSVGGIANLTWFVAGASDFDGDGKSDVLWRNSSTGADVIWKSANYATSQTMATVTDQAWIIVGAGDFNGDGKSDVLWRNGITGANAIWKSGNRDTAQAIGSVANQAWFVAGVGDFNGDHVSDILWRNSSTGANTIWKSANWTTAQAVTTLASAWGVAGVGDFDGDGKADILWRNRVTGANGIWKSGNSATGQSTAAVANLAWVVVGVGDFDGDHKADILWRNFSTGANAIWKSGNVNTPQPVTTLADLAWVVSG